VYKKGHGKCSAFFAAKTATLLNATEPNTNAISVRRPSSNSWNLSDDATIPNFIDAPRSLDWRGANDYRAT
jgi:hypothetical protein